jgi:hypothetical protein
VLNLSIQEATTLHADVIEGTKVGQYEAGSKAIFKAVIDEAVLASNDLLSNSQIQIDVITKSLQDAIILFKSKVIKAGNATALGTKITEAEQALTSHIEGTKVGQTVKADRDVLQETVMTAQSLYADSVNKTQNELDNMTRTLQEAITAFEGKVIKAGNATALGTKISEAEQALISHIEGTNVGQTPKVDRDILQESISVAQVVFTDASNKTQSELDDATRILNDSIIMFESSIIKAGDTTALSSAILEAKNIHTNSTEGIEVGEYVIGSKEILEAAINSAQLVVDSALNQTNSQIEEAKAKLDQSIENFGKSKVAALTELNNITIAGTAEDSSNSVVLRVGENLVLTSSDELGVVATVTEFPIGTIKVTGVATGSPVTITVQVKKDGQVIKTGNFTVSILNESIISKTLANFDFSTVNASTAKLVSKPVTVGDFTGNRKDFDIVIGAERIPINIYWKLSTDFPKGASMGSVVESHIQDYYFKKYGIEGFSIRNLYASGTNDTFQISSFQSGPIGSFRLEGPDWQYFFEESTAQGTNMDTSKNRTFTISDGIQTATIRLTSDFSTIEDLISQINNNLTIANVNAQAEKVSSSQFKITQTNNSGQLSIDGTDKAYFFE